jgi:hypothetical protein
MIYILIYMLIKNSIGFVLAQEAGKTMEMVFYSICMCLDVTLIELVRKFK